MFSGSIRAVIAGVAATVVLLAVLAASRLFRATPELDSEQTEIVEISAFIPPAEEPPMEDSEEVEEELVEELSAPIPALDLMVAPHIETPALPVSTMKFNPSMSVDIMEVDRAPALLPVRKVVRPVYKAKVSKPSPRPTYKAKVTTKAKPSYKPKPQPKPKPVVKAVVKPVVKAVAKSYYSASELDGMPREIRQGQFTWPYRAKGQSGVVSLKVELSSSGRVTVLSVISSSDSALNEAAKKLARTSRYTAPKKNGKAVKARFSKTYKLIKPR